MRARVPVTPADTLSRFLTGDPVRLGPEVAALGDLIAALGLGGIVRPGLLPLTHDVVLVHSLTGETGHIALRWVQLAHGPTLIAGTKPTNVAVVLTAPVIESAGALRLVARLKACLRDTALLREAGLADTREDLARALAAADAAGEVPLSGSEILERLATSVCWDPTGCCTRTVSWGSPRRRSRCSGSSGPTGWPDGVPAS